MKNKKSIVYYILMFFILLIFFPKSYMDEYNIVGNIVSGLRILFGILTNILYVMAIKNKQVSKNTIAFFIFIIITFISTLYNGRGLWYFFRVYYVNFAVLMCADLSFKNKNKKELLLFVANISAILLLINFGTVLLKDVFDIVLYNESSTYFLGMDNRFILFIIPCLLSNYYIYLGDKKKRYMRRFVFLYIVGLISLLLTWSVTSLLSMIVCAALVKIFGDKQIKLNAKIVLLLFIILNYLIVGLNILDVFNDYIINILHKTSTLSYRTVLWENAIRMIKSSPFSMMFGLGYFDTSRIIPIYWNGMGVNHLHNLLIDVTFSSGLIGLFIYLYSLFNISNNINNITDRNIIVLLLFLLLINLIFESFELYPIYYFILCLFYYSSILIGDDVL